MFISTDVRTLVIVELQYDTRLGFCGTNLFLKSLQHKMDRIESDPISQ